MPGFGRIHLPDPRDRDYLMVRRIATASPVGTKVWASPVVYDQGQTNDCTGVSSAAAVTVIAKATLGAAVELDWQAIYEWANAHDGIPQPHDGSTVRAAFQCVTTVGTTVTQSTSPSDPVGAVDQPTNYLWADTTAANADVDTIITWLLTVGPVVIGIDWYDGMMQTDVNGFLHPSGSIVGGHAILVRGVASNGDGKATFVLRNGWDGWGITVDDATLAIDTSTPGGDALLAEADLVALLLSNGEAGALTDSLDPITPAPGPSPAPTPPPAPAPTPVPPAPTPPPVPTGVVQVALGDNTRKASVAYTLNGRPIVAPRTWTVAYTSSDPSLIVHATTGHLHPAAISTGPVTVLATITEADGTLLANVTACQVRVVASEGKPDAATVTVD